VQKHPLSPGVEIWGRDCWSLRSLCSPFEDLQDCFPQRLPRFLFPSLVRAGPLSPHLTTLPFLWVSL
jgi:hypothetical protein